MGRIRALGAAIVVATALSACSSSPAATGGNGTGDESAAAVLAQASKNAQAQSTVHIRGNGACPNGPFFADVVLTKDGQAAGSVKFGPDTLSLIRTPQALYINGPAAFWTTQISASAAQRIGTKWVKFSPASNACLGALTDFSRVLDNYLGYTGSPTKKSGGTILTVPATQLVFSPAVSIWVASRGTPLPVHVDDANAGTALAFGEWSSAEHITLPPSTEVIDSTAVKK
jgi:hypothetical protein